MRHEIRLTATTEVHDILLAMSVAESKYMSAWLGAIVKPDEATLPSRLAGWLRRYASMLRRSSVAGSSQAPPTYHIPRGCWRYSRGVLSVTVTDSESVKLGKRTKRVNLEVLDEWCCENDTTLWLYYSDGWVVGCECS